MIETDIANIKEIMAHGEIYQIKWKQSVFQVTDCLRKNGATFDCLFNIVKNKRYPELNFLILILQFNKGINLF